MKNIEVKVLINDFGSILEKLKKIKAKYQGKLRQTDTYYNCPVGRLKIREINNNFFEFIFYQRPDIDEQKISNYEVININKGQLANLKKVLKMIFGEKVIIKKVRSLWIYQNTRIHLDRVKKLGNFLELETLVKDNLKKAQREYKEISSFLELKKYKKHRKSYSDIISKK